jgi:hypothetical protein
LVFGAHLARAALLEQQLTLPFEAPQGPCLNVPIGGASMRRAIHQPIKPGRRSQGGHRRHPPGDVVLAMCRRAARYLIEQNALPDRPLIAMVR